MEENTWFFDAESPFEVPPSPPGRNNTSESVGDGPPGVDLALDLIWSGTARDAPDLLMCSCLRFFGPSVFETGLLRSCPHFFGPATLGAGASFICFFASSGDSFSVPPLFAFRFFVGPFLLVAFGIFGSNIRCCSGDRLL